jgi:hypothetical protein
MTDRTPQELAHALELSEKILNDTRRDPDSDLSVLARTVKNYWDRYLALKQRLGLKPNDEHVLKAVETIHAQSASAYRAGWKLVPIEPTEDMVHAAVNSCEVGRRFGHSPVLAIWEAMVTAALPTPEADADK